MTPHDEIRQRENRAAEQLQTAWSDYVATRNFAALREELETSVLRETRESIPAGIVFWWAIDAQDWNAADTIARYNPQLIVPVEMFDEGPLHYTLRQIGDCPTIIQWLLSQGAERDRRGMNGWTPLHVAARCGHVGAINVLLEHGTPVDIGTGIDGDYTPLMEAATAGSLEAVRILLQAGADFHRTNSYEGRTAEEMARAEKFDEVVNAIREHARAH